MLPALLTLPRATGQASLPGEGNALGGSSGGAGSPAPSNAGAELGRPRTGEPGGSGEVGEAGGLGPRLGMPTGELGGLGALAARASPRASFRRFRRLLDVEGGLGDVEGTAFRCCCASATAARAALWAWRTSRSRASWRWFSCCSNANSMLRAWPRILLMPFTKASAESAWASPSMMSYRVSAFCAKRPRSTPMAESHLTTSWSSMIALNSSRSKRPLPSSSAASKSRLIFLTWFAIVRSCWFSMMVSSDEATWKVT
mmetsp:Transcript_34793/g.96207  ORF Transcript_34793/g.96207 Transcript_34793/m.96207 type:complete len:257 (-) Transcript_34793:768-1538(-)